MGKNHVNQSVQKKRAGMVRRRAIPKYNRGAL
jgi:hypothetical protein